jgi:hypothetical protein
MALKFGQASRATCIHSAVSCCRYVWVNSDFSLVSRVPLIGPNQRNTLLSPQEWCRNHTLHSQVANAFPVSLSRALWTILAIYREMLVYSTFEPSLNGGSWHSNKEWILLAVQTSLILHTVSHEKSRTQPTGTHAIAVNTGTAVTLTGWTELSASVSGHGGRWWCKSSSDGEDNCKGETHCVWRCEIK